MNVIFWIFDISYLCIFLYMLCDEVDDIIYGYSTIVHILTSLEGLKCYIRHGWLSYVAANLVGREASEMRHQDSFFLKNNERIINKMRMLP